MKTYQKEEFLETLRSATGLPAITAPIILTGFVKPSEDGHTIQFSPDASCLLWISIPDTLIEAVDHLGKISCKDHEHDYIRLHLKAPADSSDEVRALADLLQNRLSAQVQNRLSAPTQTNNLLTRAPAGYFGCGITCPTFFSPGIYYSTIEFFKWLRSNGMSGDAARQVSHDPVEMTKYIALSPFGVLSPVAGLLVSTGCADCAVDSAYS